MTYRQVKAEVLELAAVLTAALTAFDWPLIVISGGFLATVWWTWTQDALLERDPAHVDYEAAIADAAVKRPNFAVPLKTIPATTTMVNVVTFGPPGAIDPKDRSFYLWVALPSELRDACKGASKPVRRLQEILGLPPVDAPAHVVRELQVPRDGLIRPCVAGGDLESPYCSLEMPSSPATSSRAITPAPSSAPPAPAPSGVAPPTVSGVPATSGSAAPPAASSSAAPSATSSSVAPPAASGNSSYDDLYFLTKQMWSTYRVDFLASKRKASDYPYTGYPFTGMGWSYDWSDVPNHIGVSEFVVRRSAPVTVVNTKAPAEFCAQ